jgi:internalin A
VLLVTPAFLASEYVVNHELPDMLRAARSEGLTIFWIPVKDSSYDQSDIGGFQAAHPPDKPLSHLVGANRDRALVNIVKKLTEALGLGKARSQ